MNAASVIRKVGNAALDLIYPPGLYCISCGKICDASRTYGLCNECMEAVDWVTSPVSAGGGHACVSYNAVAQAVIFAFKYGGRSEIGDKISEIMYDRMAAEYGADALAGMYDMVVPVPIYREKKKRRGFNHADIMAEGFAERAGLRYEADLLVRTRETQPMKGLGRDERRANISGAFGIRQRRLEALKGAKVLLVDDIYTTGATTGEIRSLLERNGAAKTEVLAFAAAGSTDL